MKKIKQHYKNLIIGFGKGGKTLAAFLAKQGEEVALVEQSEMMYGGTCINVACIPTKSLITNAEKKIPYGDAFEIKNDLTSFLRKKNFDTLDSQPLITVIDGTASFMSDRQVRIVSGTSGSVQVVSGERIFINTGTEPSIPNIEGVKGSKKVFTSTSLMEQSGLPRKLIVIGAGFIGLEFADMYAKFGSEVTLLDQGQIFLPKEDRDIANEIHKILTKKHVRIISGASVQRVKDTAEGLVVQYKNADNKIVTLEGSAALIATGRKANVDGLNLAAAGIQSDKRGFITVNDRLQTSVPNIWAIGDINGGPQFTYISLDDFRIIRDQLFDGKYTSVKQRKAVASTVFVTPPLAHIGLREREAAEKGHKIKVAKLSASAIPRARILNETRGVLRSVVDAETNKILGCTLLCAEASEMINTIQIAMNAGLDYRVVRDTIFTHPSMTEAFNDLYSSID
jgi:pyruvate/2-oxoglutarate dehydrogenase complex dihydrolipoamide dehydrogenase (E3) component